MPTAAHRLRLASRSFGPALLALLLAPALVLAAYPPGPYTGAGPTGAFPTVVMSETLGTGGGTLTATSGSATLSLVIPPGAFTQDTQITIYGGATAVLGALLPADATLVEGYAVGWTPQVPATTPLTLTISDPRIGPADVVFETTGAGLTQAGNAVVQAGTARVTFTTDPGVVVAIPASTPTPSPTPAPTAHPAATPSVSPTGTPPAALPPTTLAGPTDSGGGTPSGALLLLVAALAGVSALLGGWEVRRRATRTVRR